ncbi:MAG: type II toxin-antitoxin system RelE/ParE family toxin [Chitinophagales bacterium]|nr:type II toxin-antitoxin system RelE/ParE family toxin [Chitinophagales bacterium]
MGTALGKNCFKIRMAITSKGRGKSGGARIITHVFVAGTIIYLLSIYDKSDQENISEKEILYRINQIPK